MDLRPVPNTVIKSDNIWLSWFRDIRDWVSTKLVQKTGDTMSGALAVDGAGTAGSITLQPGGAGRSGWIEFLSDAGVRQGYVGYSPTNNPFDTGIVEYVAGSHNFLGVVNAITGTRTVTGVLAAVPTATATTMFAASQGLWLVTAYIPGLLPGLTGYAASASVIHDGTGIRVIPQNDTNLTITGSGVNVQVTQTSGVNQTVGFSALRIF